MTPSTPNATRTPAVTGRRRTAIVMALLAACIASSFAQTALTTALPALMTDLNITAVHGNWLTSGFSLAMGVIVPATAFMMKRFPTKALFLTGLALFCGGLILAALAPSFPVLMAARIAQAVGSGLSLSLTQVIILTMYHGHGVGKAMGYYGLAVGAAPVIAPTLSGMMVDLWGWRSIFWVSGAIAVIVFALTVPVMRNVLPLDRAARIDVCSTWGLASVEQRYASDASALLTSLRTIAGALGSAVFVAVMVAFGDDPRGVDIAFAAMAALAAAGCLAAVILCRRRVS